MFLSIHVMPKIRNLVDEVFIALAWLFRFDFVQQIFAGVMKLVGQIVKVGSDILVFVDVAKVDGRANDSCYH